MSDPLNPQDRYPQDRYPQDRYPLRDACQEKARATGEQTFTLRAQDRSSPFIIAEWIKENIETCPSHKLYEALAIALKMREHRDRKTAD